MVLRIFTLGWKILWVITTLFITLVEIFPFDNLHVSPVLFYIYEFLKTVGFVLFGFEIPLSFWRFESLNRGLVLSLISAAAIEGTQALVMGHKFSALELLLKGVLIMSGFTFGILRRHEEQLSFFGLHVRLIPVRRF